MGAYSSGKAGDDAVPAGALRFVERFVGTTEHRFRLIGRRNLRDTDADRRRGRQRLATPSSRTLAEEMPLPAASVAMPTGSRPCTRQVDPLYPSGACALSDHGGGLLLQEIDASCNDLDRLALASDERGDTEQATDDDANAWNSAESMPSTTSRNLNRTAMGRAGP